MRVLAVGLHFCRSMDCKLPPPNTPVPCLFRVHSGPEIKGVYKICSNVQVPAPDKLEFHRKWVLHNSIDGEEVYPYAWIELADFQDNTNDVFDLIRKDKKIDFVFRF